jgi:GTP pyrophosphokinase
MRGESVSDDAIDRARGVLLEFRAAHRLPLTKATMGLRSAVIAEGCRVEISQRLKRTRTMLDKLTREPTMALASMQDVGGCRAVLDTIDEVRSVQHRLLKRRGRTPKRVDDYIASPRKSGYRGVHVIVQYDGRNIEIQLRTRVMHEWAIYVERLSGRLHADLKSARGPRVVLEWLEAVSQAMGLEEEGIFVDTGLMERIARLREVAFRYLEGG